jgi:hypothetical protein
MVLCFDLWIVKVLLKNVEYIQKVEEKNAYAIQKVKLKSVDNFI